MLYLKSVFLLFGLKGYHINCEDDLHLKPCICWTFLSYWDEETLWNSVPVYLAVSALPCMDVTRVLCLLHFSSFPCWCSAGGAVHCDQFIKALELCPDAHNK